MLLLLYELDVCLMTMFMFQEHMASSSLTKNLNKTVEESIKEHPTNLFIHDSSEEHAFPQILSSNHTCSSKFSPMVSKFQELDSSLF